MVNTKRTSPSWKQVKDSLSELDRPALISLVKDLYAAGRDNQIFLHARFGLGDDVLKPYKTAINRWLWPDVFKNQDTSIAKAKKAITDYKKAGGRPEGLAELLVYFCERGIGFSNFVGMADEGHFDALVRMFERAIAAVAALPEACRPQLMARLAEVRDLAGNLGYGVSEEMDELLADWGFE